MIAQLKAYIDSLDIKQVSEDRKAILQPLISYILRENTVTKPIHLNFICTHNSRRSHLAQIWAQVMAHYVGISDIHTYSGGTEVTAFNGHAVAALEACGMQVKIDQHGANPKFSISFDLEKAPIVSWSKLFSEAVPKGIPYAAIMTCSSADQGCPFIPEAEIRIPVTYEDPKKSDGTGKEREVYGERCKQIATEMRYVMEQVKFGSTNN